MDKKLAWYLQLLWKLSGSYLLNLRLKLSARSWRIIWLSSQLLGKDTACRLWNRLFIILGIVPFNVWFIITSLDLFSLLLDTSLLPIILCYSRLASQHNFISIRFWHCFSLIGSPLYQEGWLRFSVGSGLTLRRNCLRRCCLCGDRCWFLLSKSRLWV